MILLRTVETFGPQQVANVQIGFRLVAPDNQHFTDFGERKP